MGSRPQYEHGEVHLFFMWRKSRKIDKKIRATHYEPSFLAIAHQLIILIRVKVLVYSSKKQLYSAIFPPPMTATCIKVYKRYVNIFSCMLDNRHIHARQFKSICLYINVFFITSDNLTLSEVIMLLTPPRTANDCKITIFLVIHYH